MTTYANRDLRAVDLLAIILFGFGVILLVFAMSKTFGWWDAVGMEDPKGEPKLDRAAPGSGNARGLWLLATVFLMLGGALNLKLRQIVRNGGREPEGLFDAAE